MHSSSSNESIGKRVAELRKHQHYTQAQLANIIGITSKHLSEIERGVTGISIDTQVELSDTLNCSIDYLIKGDAYKSIDSLLPDSIVSILRSDDDAKKSLLIEYMMFFDRISNS